MFQKVKRLTFFLPFFLFSFSVTSYTFEKFKNSNGMTGIVDMPAAGSRSDGEFSFSSVKLGANFKNTLAFQALPRLNLSFRYSGIGDKETGWIKSGYSYWDRSFDIRLDLLKESSKLPDITLGLQDFIGTGQYSAEYFVASKTISNKLRVSAGLGTGRLASTNKIKNSGIRINNSGGQFGGLFRQGSLFTGPIGAFGGIEYKPPIENIILSAEYSSDDYSADAGYIKNLPESKINLSTKYKVSENMHLAGYYVGGNSLGLQLNLTANPNNSYGGNYLQSQPQPFYSFPIPEQNNEKIWEKIKINLKEEKINIIASSLKDNIATIVIENNHYGSETQAIGRTLRIMSRHIPMSYEIFNVTLSNYNIPITQILINRNEVSEIIDAPNSELITLKLTEIESAPRVISDTVYRKKRKESFSWSLSPYYKLHLFDPDNPLYYDLGPRIRFKYDIKPSLILEGTIEQSILTSFNEVRRGIKGKLPKVRTELKNYLNTTKNSRINDLYLASYFKASKNIYGRFTLGYLESMYAGLSSELLYSPSEKNYAFGIEVNKVKARDYDQLFGLRDLYKLAETNGHVSLYLDTNYYFYDAQIDYGKYLAGDKGYTFTLTRNFPNNWRAGGFFSITDASHSDFGEGSFDKGFFFSVPFSSVLPYETKSGISELVRPIQGDGGQKLYVQGRLNEAVSQNRKHRLINTWAKIWR